MTYIPESNDRVVYCNLKDRHAIVPVRAHADDAGADLFATEDLSLEPFVVVRTDTMLAIEIPKGSVGMIVGRSSMNAKGVLTHKGTIDSGYRGTLGVILQNLTQNTISIRKGERLAQLLVIKVETPDFVSVDRRLSASSRGEGGFGSTGK